MMGWMTRVCVGVSSSSSSGSYSGVGGGIVRRVRGWMGFGRGGGETQRSSGRGVSIAENLNTVTAGTEPNGPSSGTITLNNVSTPTSTTAV